MKQLCRKSSIAKKKLSEIYRDIAFHSILIDFTVLYRTEFIDIQ